MLTDHERELIRRKVSERPCKMQKRIEHLLDQHDLALEIASYGNTERKRHWRTRAFDLAETLRKAFLNRLTTEQVS